MSTATNPKGVMDGSYADARLSALHLMWRYRVRARFAAHAYRRAEGGGGSPRVLDLGAAEGATLLALRDLLGSRGEYHGVELAEDLLAKAPALPDRVRLFAGDVTALPSELPTQPYDLCTVLAVLEHLPEPLACLRQAHARLRPGGVLVASCPHPLWDEVAGALGMVADEHHESAMTRSKLESLARDAGFVDVRVHPFMWAPTGLLPYLRVDVDERLALRVDRWIGRLPMARHTFVNQGLVARKVMSR